MNAFEFALPGAPTAPGFGFPSERFTIGSGPEVALRFDARLVEPKHAEVAFDPKGVPWIRDLTDKGLLKVNGVVTTKAPLAIGARVTLGRLDLEVRLAELKLDATARRPTPFATPPLDATARRPTPFQAPPAVRTSQAGKVSSPRIPAITRDAPVTGDDSTSLSKAYVPKAEADVAAEDGRTVLPEGSIVGNRYRIIKKLAAGGMGEVYQAEHIELHKQFAVKVMLPALSADQDFVNRFKREAISASRIGQQNIIDISDFGQTDDGRFYFAMEFLDGVTIASLLHRQGPLPVQRMVNIALQTTRALASAHSQGIVHRDMKPENVMVLQRPGQSDFVKVLDFGVAKVATGPAQGGQTQLGMVVGTPQYMSPEQAMGVAVDARTDTYAMGLILYEMLSGVPTFNGDTASILMVKQVTEPAPPFSPELAASVPAALHDLIFQMLEKDPNKRPESLDQVVDVLETLLAHLKVGAKLPPATTSGRFPSTATPHSLNPVRITSSGMSVARPPSAAQAAVTIPEEPVVAPKSKVPLIVAALVVLGLVGGGAVMAFKPTPKPPEPVVVAPPKIDPLPLAVVPLEKVETPPPPKLVTLTLTSTPPAAQVLKDGAVIGTTPFSLELEKGEKFNVELSLPGYVKEPLALAPVSSMTMDVALKKVGGAKVGTPAKIPGEKPKDLGDNPYGGQVKDLQDDPYQ